jgi:hypothetical protein
MRNMLLSLMVAGLASPGCGSQSNGQKNEPVSGSADTIIRYTRDTIIKHKAAGTRDTIIKYVSTLPECCDQVPRPPDCPPPKIKLMRMDTIIK